MTATEVLTLAPSVACGGQKVIEGMPRDGTRLTPREALTRVAFRKTWFAGGGGHSLPAALRQLQKPMAPSTGTT